MDSLQVPSNVRPSEAARSRKNFEVDTRNFLSDMAIKPGMTGLGLHQNVGQYDRDRPLLRDVGPRTWFAIAARETCLTELIQAASPAAAALRQHQQCTASPKANTQASSAEVTTSGQAPAAWTAVDLPADPEAAGVESLSADSITTDISHASSMHPDLSTIPGQGSLVEAAAQAMQYFNERTRYGRPVSDYAHNEILASGLGSNVEAAARRADGQAVAFATSLLQAADLGDTPVAGQQHHDADPVDDDDDEDDGDNAEERSMGNDADEGAGHTSDAQADDCRQSAQRILAALAHYDELLACRAEEASALSADIVELTMLACASSESDAQLASDSQSSPVPKNFKCLQSIIKWSVDMKGSVPESVDTLVACLTEAKAEDACEHYSSLPPLALRLHNRMLRQACKGKGKQGS